MPDRAAETIPAALLDAAQRFADAEALVGESTRLTYAALATAAAEVAKALMASGVESGDRVAIWAPNSAVWVVASFGVYLSGGVLVPLNTRYKADEAGHVLRTARARLLLTVTDFEVSDFVAALDTLADLGELQERVVMSGPAPAGTTSWADFLARADTVTDEALAARSDSIDAESTSDIIFTSGTTGAPKGAMLAHGASVRTYRAWSDLVGLRAGDRYLVVYPFFHTAGLKSGVLASILTGAAILPQAVFDVPAVMRRVAEERVSMLPGPPTVFQSILNDPDLASYDLSSLRLSVTGAAVVPVAIVRRMREELHFENVVTGYGLTETTGTVSMCRHDDPLEVIAQTVGRPLPGVEIRVVDDDEHDLAAGEPGELLVRGFNVMQGYFENPEATASAFAPGGWLRTGDIGFVDGGGNVHITDRKKDMYIVGGFNAYPAEIEAALLGHPAVAQAAVVGVPHERMGEVGAAFVVAKAGMVVDPDEVIAWSREHMANFKVPNRVVVVDSLPLNPSGKVMKFVLRDELAADTTGHVQHARPTTRALAVEPGASVEEAVAAVRAWINEFVPDAWRDAAERGGHAAIREVRSRAAYEQWYPVFGRSGLVVPTWPVAYGGLDLTPAVARQVDAELRPYNLGRLNPLGLNLAAPALFAHGTEEQRLRYLPPIVRNEEVWCQLFSEPGAGSDLASLATRAEQHGAEWVVNGQKVWTTWAHLADFGVLLARTDPDVPKRKGITYFLVDLHAPGVDVRPLRHIGGEIDFNEVFLDQVRIGDDCRVGAIGDGWKVANATLSGERQMVSGSGSGGVDRIGGSGAEHLVELAKRVPRGAGTAWDDPTVRQQVMGLYSEECIRGWTNQRVRSQLKAGRAPGPESSVGKVHQGELNQRIQVLATDLLGPAATAWECVPDGYGASLPREVKGMLRSRANTIEGGTTEVNKNIVGERVLGLPREPDQWRGSPWRVVPRS